MYKLNPFNLLSIYKSLQLFNIKTLIASHPIWEYNFANPTIIKTMSIENNSASVTKQALAALASAIEAQGHKREYAEAMAASIIF